MPQGSWDKGEVRGIEQAREIGEGDWFTWRSPPHDDLLKKNGTLVPPASEWGGDSHARI
jgi:hypothetical protein